MIRSVEEVNNRSGGPCSRRPNVVIKFNNIKLMCFLSGVLSQVIRVPIRLSTMEKAMLQQSCPDKELVNIDIERRTAHFGDSPHVARNRDLNRLLARLEQDMNERKQEKEDNKRDTELRYARLLMSEMVTKMEDYALKQTFRGINSRKGDGKFFEYNLTNRSINVGYFGPYGPETMKSGKFRTVKINALPIDIRRQALQVKRNVETALGSDAFKEMRMAARDRNDDSHSVPVQYAAPAEFQRIMQLAVLHSGLPIYAKANSMKQYLENVYGRNLAAILDDVFVIQAPRATTRGSMPPQSSVSMTPIPASRQSSTPTVASSSGPSPGVNVANMPTPSSDSESQYRQ